MQRIYHLNRSFLHGIKIPWYKILRGFLFVVRLSKHLSWNNLSLSTLIYMVESIRIKFFLLIAKNMVDTLPNTTCNYLWWKMCTSWYLFSQKTINCVIWWIIMNSPTLFCYVFYNNFNMFSLLKKKIKIHKFSHIFVSIFI